MNNDSTSCHSALKAGCGVLMIVCTFVYFLIFAEFAFLELLNEIHSDWDQLQSVMALLGIGGITGSAVVGINYRAQHRSYWMITGFAGCAASALVAVANTGTLLICITACAIGLFLGILTVSLVASLPYYFNQSKIGFKAGIGTGVAYALCNVPVLFHASAQIQAISAAFFCMAGLLVCMVDLLTKKSIETAVRNHQAVGQGNLLTPARLVHFLVMFLLLIWLDSAAFFIIQHSAELKIATWGSDSMLWLNAALHFGVALIAGCWIDRGGIKYCLTSSFVCMAWVALLLQGQSSLNQYAHFFYVAGVSLYSTPLVAFAALPGSKLKNLTVAACAAWLYALAGWIGSGMGIGMAQDLNRIPLIFLILVGLVFVFSLLPLLQPNSDD